MMVEHADSIVLVHPDPQAQTAAHPAVFGCAARVPLQMRAMAQAVMLNESHKL
jgi:hypothetical protein